MTAEQELKEEVYALFKQHPELLYPVEEGLTKGGQLLSCRQWQPPTCCLRRAAAFAPAEQHSTTYTFTSALHTACPCSEGAVAPAEQHRAFVRKQLQVILASGHSPMTYFTKVGPTAVCTFMSTLVTVQQPAAVKAHIASCLTGSRRGILYASDVGVTSVTCMAL